MNTRQSLRFTVLGAVFTLVGILIIARMVRIQLGPEREVYVEQGKGFLGGDIVLRPYRGQIYDRWGNLLAGNELVYEIGVDMLQKFKPNTIALIGSQILRRDHDTVLSELANAEEVGLRQYTLDNYGSQEAYDQLMFYIEQSEAALENGAEMSEFDQSLQAIVFQTRQKRVYPEKTLGSNLLGFQNLLYESAYGIEMYYDDILTGIEKKYWQPNDPNLAVELKEPSEGTSIILTIDREIQAMVEAILDDAVQKNGAQGGTIVIMHPETGEILAMASAPRIDLNEFWQHDEVFDDEHPFNLAIYSYEPGSVFKIITMVSALDNGNVTPETTYIDTGIIYVGGIPIYNWDYGAYGPQTMLGCMQHSLNVCLAWVATEMGTSDFYKYLQAFGFGRPTGIELAGELSGILRLPNTSDWHASDLGTNSFGQGLSVTPVQMLMALSAVANDGQMVAPRIVRGYVDRGKTYETSAQVTGTPIKAETARTLTEMLAVSLEAEASDALVPGYRVAGKTGTAEISIPGSGYTQALTNASFVGWGPVDDPQFLVYVWLVKPTSSIWGSVVAAPVFHDVVERLVVLMNLPPDMVRESIASP